ncbi:MAG: hypothetical protein AAB036_08730 [Elusimicrobiota bacterium]
MKNCLVGILGVLELGMFPAAAVALNVQTPIARTSNAPAWTVSQPVLGASAPMALAPISPLSGHSLANLVFHAPPVIIPQTARAVLASMSEGTKASLPSADLQQKSPETSHISASASFAQLNGEFLIARQAIPDEVLPPALTIGTPADSARVRTLFAKARETYEAAQRQQSHRPNFSGFHVYAAVELDDGRWTSAGNMELSRKHTLCAERSAIIGALGAAEAGAKVRTIVVSNSGETFKKICAECLGWMATDKFFSPDTRIVSVEYDPGSDKIRLHGRSVKDILPFHFASPQPSWTDQQIGSLAVELSPAAQGTSPKAMRSLMKSARAAYDDGQAENFSAKPQAAAVQLTPFWRGSAVRFEWAPRFSEEEDLQAAASALKKAARAQGWLRAASRLADRLTFKLLGIEAKAARWLAAPLIDAVAYYGKDSNLPIQSFGRLIRRGASAGTKILRIENGRLVVRTLGEVMTEIYVRDTRP